MTSAEAEAYLAAVLTPLCLVLPSAELYRSALSIHLETQYRFYDSLILAGALAGQAGVLYSEDLPADRRIRGVRIVNPF